MAQQLHLIQAQLSSKEFEQQCRRYVSDKDSILFLNDSVFTLTDKHFNSDEFRRLIGQISILALTEHLQARNIISHVAGYVEEIDYPTFVSLSQQANKVVSW